MAKTIRASITKFTKVPYRYLQWRVTLACGHRRILYRRTKPKHGTMMHCYECSLHPTDEGPRR